MADVFFKRDELDRAITYYSIIIHQEQSEYTEESLNKLSQIYLEKGAIQDALPILQRLEEEASVRENILFAQSNLMKLYYETGTYEAALTYAHKILLKDKIGITLENDAKAIIARTSLKKEDYTTSKKYYTDIEKTANKELKAEALYYISYFKNKQKEYDESNKIIQKLIEKYATYKYWAVKSYVIMGKNYYGLKDLYQATFVLENVIKNFKEFENIVKEAQLELNAIKKMRPNQII